MTNTRALRRVAIGLLVLVALLLTADRVGVLVAEKAAASTLQQAEDLQTKPSVGIGGFPFLTQLVARELHRVSIGANDVVVGGHGHTVRIATIDAVLHDVSISSDLSTVHARSAAGTGVLRYSDLSTLLGVSVRYAGSAGSGAGRVSASKTVEAAGQQFTGTVTAGVSVADGVLAFVAPRVDGAAAALPPAVLTALQAAFDVSVPLTNLPFGLRVRSIAARPDGVAVSLAATDLSFRR